MSDDNTDIIDQEQDAYCDKQFEEYLRLNPVTETEDLDDCPPLGIATAENAARARMILGTKVEEVVTRSRCDDSDPEYIICCNCEYIEWEIYSFRYKSSVYCNQCAVEVCGILIDKPQYAFNIQDDLYKFNKINNIKYNENQYTIFINFKKKYDFTVDEAFYYIQACHCCGEQILNVGDEFCSDNCEQNFRNGHTKCIYKQGDFMCKMCIYNDNKEAEEAEEALVEYSEEEVAALSKYAEKHNLTIKEAIDYQTHCHCCGKEVTNPVFDEENHQYCKKKCFEYCEDYCYECSRGKECKVCEIWQYHAQRDSITAYDVQLDKSEPILATIDAFQELNVYNQLYECLGDMTEYFKDLVFYKDDEDA